MVKGLKTFKEYFRDYRHYYVIIGGTACDILMDEAGIGFRGTKDLDIVILIKDNYSEFIDIFWKFVRLGQYNTQEKKEGRYNKYRFSHPQIPGYPDTLELFSKDTLGEDKADHQFTMRVITEDDVSDISAIILEPDYYYLIESGRIEINDISLLDAPYIIPLKARAWTDLRNRKEKGGAVDRNNVKKHLNDVIRLAQLLIPGNTLKLADSIFHDLKNFLQQLDEMEIPALSSIQQTFKSKKEVLDLIRSYYAV